MPDKFIRFILKSMFRSRTRLLATVGGCMVAALIICFFVSAGHSLGLMLQQADEDGTILVVTQKDRY